MCSYKQSVKCVILLALLHVSLAARVFADFNSGNTENESLRRNTRSIRFDRSWTRSGYGVVFVYSDAFRGYELNIIKSAAAEVRKHSCIPVTLLSESVRNQQPQKHPHYVYIEKNVGVGCGQAFVGMRGGYQLLTLNPDPQCLTIATVIHEMMHTLGIEHEQSRPDRNQYINIHNPNVQSGLQNVFGIAHGSSAFGPYDFDSVMHYGKFAFSAFPNLPTLTSKIQGYNVPDWGNLKLSYWDKRKINAITGCKLNE